MTFDELRLIFFMVSIPLCFGIAYGIFRARWSIEDKKRQSE